MKVHFALPDRTLKSICFIQHVQSLARYFFFYFFSFKTVPDLKIVGITESKGRVHKLNSTLLINGGASSNLLPARGGGNLTIVLLGAGSAYRKVTVGGGRDPI
jgi:hypothetical protein